MRGDERRDLDDDYEPRPRRRPHKSSGVSTTLLVGLGVGTLCVFGCCGGLLLLGSRHGNTTTEPTNTTVKLGETATFRHFQVTVTGARVGAVSATSPAGHPVVTNVDHISVTIEIRNTDTKNI